MSKERSTRMRGNPGGTLSEYGLLFGLVSVLSMVGLAFLGGSTSTLLGGSGNAGQNSNLTHAAQSMLAPAQQGSAENLVRNNSNFRNQALQLSFDSDSGRPTLTYLENGAAPVNTTSLDGNTRNSLGSIMLGQRLEELAAEEKDPKTARLLEEIAKATYYLGAVEGDMDDVPELEHNPAHMEYTDGDTLRDIVYYQQKLGQLIKQLPPTASNMQALALATEAYNIAQTNYINPLSEYIDSRGQVPQNFELPKVLGTPGSTITQAAEATISNVPVSAPPYEQFLPYDELKVAARKVLTNNKVDSRHVEVTLTNATVIQATAATR